MRNHIYKYNYKRYLSHPAGYVEELQIWQSILTKSVCPVDKISHIGVAAVLDFLKTQI